MSAKETQEKNPGSDEGLSFRELLKFFLPLAVTPLFITTTHSLMNATIARLPYPELSIAVFTVVKGVTNAVKAPTFMFMQIIISQVDDRKSFYKSSKFIWTVCGLFFVLLFLLGYTRIGGWFLRNIIGLDDPRAIEFAYMAMRITCFLPLVETLRNINRGLIVSHKRTKISSAATAVRLVIVVSFLGIAAWGDFMPGIVAGALAWTGGIGIEGVMILLGVIWLFSSPGKAAEKLPKFPEVKRKTIDFWELTSFFLPLALMRFLNSTINPIVQSGIARSPVNPTRALAVYGVAFGVMRVIASPVGYLNNVSLVYVKQNVKNKWRKTRKFCFLVGLSSSVILFFLFITPLGYWILLYVMGVSEEIASTGNWVLLAFSPYPLFQALRESYWGLLMNNRETKAIGVAKGLNAAAVFAVIFVIVLFLPWIMALSPAVVGALSFTIGQGVETFVVRYFSHKKIELVNETSGQVESYVFNLFSGE